MSKTPLFYAYPSSDNAKKFGMEKTGCYYFSFKGDNYAAEFHAEINYLALVNGVELDNNFGENNRTAKKA